MSLDRRLREEFDRLGAHAPTGIPPGALSTVVETAGRVRRRKRRERYFTAIAVVLVLVGGVGMWRAGIPGMDVSPQPVVNSPSPSPSASGLTQTYTSAEHHFQISYPDGWTVKAATKPWKYGNWTTFAPGTTDVLRAPDGSGWIITSQLIPANLTDQQWLHQYTAPNPGSPNACFPRYTGYQRIVVDGHPGGVHGGVSPCNFTEAVVIVGNRAYQITASPSLDFASGAVYDLALFNQMLATIQFTNGT